MNNEDEGKVRDIKSAAPRVHVERIAIGRKDQGTPDAEFICINVLPIGAVAEPFSFEWLLDEGDEDKVSEMLDSIALAAKFFPLDVDEVIASWQKFRTKSDTTPSPPRAA